MFDPVTIGALAASALAIAAPEVVKSVVGQSVKDAYNALKDRCNRQPLDRQVPRGHAGGALRLCPFRNRARRGARLRK